MFVSSSAGTRPVGFIHPLAVYSLNEINVSSSSLTSKHWSVFADRNFDICIVLCPAAEKELKILSNWGAYISWPVPDPSHGAGTQTDREAFCLQVTKQITDCISDFLNKISPSMSLLQIQDTVRQSVNDFRFQF